MFYPQRGILGRYASWSIKGSYIFNKIGVLNARIGVHKTKLDKVGVLNLGFAKNNFTIEGFKFWLCQNRGSLCPGCQEIGGLDVW